MKIKLDENVHRQIAPLLIAYGHDVTTVAGEGLAGTDDASVAAVAKQEGGGSAGGDGVGAGGPRVCDPDHQHYGDDVGDRQARERQAEPVILHEHAAEQRPEWLRDEAHEVVHAEGG